MEGKLNGNQTFQPENGTGDKMIERTDLAGIGNIILNEISSPGYLSSINNYRPTGYSPAPRIVNRFCSLLNQQSWINRVESFNTWTTKLIEFIDADTTPNSVLNVLKWGLEYINEVHRLYEVNDSPNPENDSIIETWKWRSHVLNLVISKYTPATVQIEPNPISSDLRVFSLNEIREMENLTWSLIPMGKVVDHFVFFSEVTPKGGKAYLSDSQLISFLKKGFLGFDSEPMQKLNMGGNDKQKVIRRFYDFYVIASSNGYGYPNKKLPFMNLVVDCFSNWDHTDKIKNQFVPRPVKPAKKVV